jgi:hypothetical protein
MNELIILTGFLIVAIPIFGITYLIEKKLNEK